MLVKLSVACHACIRFVHLLRSSFSFLASTISNFLLSNLVFHMVIQQNVWLLSVVT